MTTLTPAARKLGEQPAFPHVEVNDPGYRWGLTKREYLIAKALAGGWMSAAAIELADNTLNALAEEQQTKASHDGWTEWKGGDCPVPGETIVECKFVAGDSDTLRAKDFHWANSWGKGNIVSYRIVEEQP